MTEAARLRRWSDSQHGAQNYIAWQLLVLVDITGTVQFVHFYFDLVCIFLMKYMIVNHASHKHNKVIQF